MRGRGLTGAVTAAVAGLLMVGFLAAAGQLRALLPAAVTFTVAVVAAGVAFDLLVEGGRLRLGYGPGIVYWSVAFPLVRLAQEGVSALSGAGTLLGEGPVGFLVWQVLVGSAFGLGYLMLYQQIGAWRQ